MSPPRSLALALVLTLAATSAAAAAHAAIRRPEPPTEYAPLPEPRKVEVALTGNVTIEALLRAGLDIVDVREDAATLLEWPGEAPKLASLGAVIRVLDEHPGRTAAMTARNELGSASGSYDLHGPPHRTTGTAVAPPYGGGSMGGYWTTAEIKAKLDDLVSQDTHDVVADKIDTVGYSREGRPIWGLEIGRHVTGPDARPVVFYNALTHARESGGMLALFYFIDDLLARYGTDPFATYLLDKRRIYICPLVNPDGFRVNEDTYTSTLTFGLWRKNTRDNNLSGGFDPANDGVDLNRNYGFQWGLDDIGSSPDMTSETYRGPSAFSEPETQAQRNLVLSLTPRTGLSFHTYQDLMLHPWGYTTAPPPDAAAFHEWNDLLTRDNGYQSGQSGPLLYTVNGEFNDWCYGDVFSKPRAYTWTPEIGNPNDFFWPPPSRIVPLAQQTLRASYVVAAIAGAYVQQDGWSILEGALNASRGATLTIRARNVGVGASAGGGLTGTLTPLDPGVRMLRSTVPYPTLAPRTSGNPSGGAAFEMVVNDTVTAGRMERFLVQFSDTSGLVSRDTVSIPFGTPTVLVTDGASSGMGQWTVSPAGTWGIVMNDPAHPSRYFADSPSGFYGIGSTATMTLNPPLNFSAGVHAYAVYETRWDIERDNDAGVVEASLNGTTWLNVRGRLMTPGSGLGVQTAGRWFYCGSRWQWSTDWADLSDFTGPAGAATRLRFRLRSDGSTNFDGISMDSLRVLFYDPAAQPALVAVGPGPAAGKAELESPWPNPAEQGARFEFALAERVPASLEVVDLQGRVVRTLSSGVTAPGRYVRQWDLTDAAGHRASPGVYFLRLATPNLRLVRRLVVIS
jgi:carboxypeptidase T